MNAHSLAVRPATEGDLSDVETLLARSGLPHRDVRSSPAEFYVGSVDEDPVAVGGLEPGGSAGLLRSVAVAEPVRGQGYGTSMCDELESVATAEGMEALYLLTTTAADFFADRGYEEISRTDAPPAIQRTTEFAEMCPDSATCMRLTLDGSVGGADAP